MKMRSMEIVSRFICSFRKVSTPVVVTRRERERDKGTECSTSDMIKVIIAS